jgi:phage host-nuclease inhibitor protein Gam
LARALLVGGCLNAIETSARLSTRQDVEAAIAELAGVRNDLSITAAHLNDLISKARAHHEPIINSLLARSAELEKRIERWAGDHRLEFGDRKSMEFSQAVVGFRMAPASVKFLEGWDFARVIDAAKKKFKRFVRIKSDLDRQRILSDYRKDTPAVTDSELKTIGVAIWREEKFFVEIKAEHS